MTMHGTCVICWRVFMGLRKRRWNVKQNNRSLLLTRCIYIRLNPLVSRAQARWNPNSHLQAIASGLSEQLVRTTSSLRVELVTKVDGYLLID